jgi:hypothetical protein
LTREKIEEEGAPQNPDDEGGDMFVYRWGGRAKVEVSEAQVYAFVCMMTKKKVDE